MKLYLLTFKLSALQYSGRWFQTYGGFVCSVSRYILTRQTLMKVGEEVIIVNTHCPCPLILPSHGEDIWIGKCLKYLNISHTETTDELGRERFNHFSTDVSFILNVGTSSNER